MIPNINDMFVYKFSAKNKNEIKILYVPLGMLW